MGKRPGGRTVGQFKRGMGGAAKGQSLRRKKKTRKKSAKYKKNKGRKNRLEKVVIDPSKAVQKGSIVVLDNASLFVDAEIDDDFAFRHELDEFESDKKDSWKSDDFDEVFAEVFADFGHTKQASQSSVRVARLLQYVIHDYPQSVACVSVCGKNKLGQELLKCLSVDGVCTAFKHTFGDLTPIEAVLRCPERKKSYTISNLARCRRMSPEDIQGGGSVGIRFSAFDVPPPTMFEAGKIFLLTGEFVTQSPDVALYAAQFALDKGKMVVLHFNPSSAESVDCSKVKSVLPFVDVLTCCAETLPILAGSQKGTEFDIGAACSKLSSVKKRKATRPRVVLCYCASESAVVAAVGQTVDRYDHKPVNAATSLLPRLADAFAGGLLAQIARSRSLGEAIRCGQWAAAFIAQRARFTLPSRPLRREEKPPADFPLVVEQDQPTQSASNGQDESSSDEDDESESESDDDDSDQEFVEADSE